MVNFIPIGITNINRVRLGDTIFMFKACKEIFESLGIISDYDKLKNILMDASYVNSFYNINDITEDIIKTILGENIDTNIEISDILIKNFEEIDRIVSTRLINIEMLKYLNKELWPSILEFIVKMAKDDVFGKMIINVNIPYSNFLTLYDFKTKCDNECEDVNKIILHSISDIIIWMLSNRIDSIRPEDFTLTENNLQFDIIIYI